MLAVVPETTHEINDALSAEIEMAVKFTSVDYFIAHFDLDTFVDRIAGETLSLSDRAQAFVDGLLAIYEVPVPVVQLSLF